MVYIYTLCSSLLMYFISYAAAAVRDEHEGVEWLFLLTMTTVITLIRFADTLSKRLYKKYSGEKRKLTITDLLVFDGVMYILYGLTAVSAHNINNISTWLLMLFLGCPTLVVTTIVIVDRFKNAFELINEKQHDPLRSYINKEEQT